MGNKYRAGVISDLHLEFDSMDRREWPKFNKYDADLWINAGDTHIYKSCRDLFRQEFEGVPYFEVLGNHDYWTNEIQIDDGGHVWEDELNNYDLRLIGAPLWTDLTENPVVWEKFKQYMVDYRKIKPVLSLDKLTNVYNTHKQYIIDNMADVVITHHLPSFRSVHKRWTDHDLNSAFASEFGIEQMPYTPILWVHGHTHDPCIYMAGTTLVVCNPRGYPGEDNYRNYKPVFVEIDTGAGIANVSP